VKSKNIKKIILSTLTKSWGLILHFLRISPRLLSPNKVRITLYIKSAPYKNKNECTTIFILIYSGDLDKEDAQAKRPPVKWNFLEIWSSVNVPLYLSLILSFICMFMMHVVSILPNALGWNPVA